MSIAKMIEGLPNRSAAERARMRDNARRLQSEGTAAQKAEAAALLAALDAFEARAHDAFIGELKSMELPERIVRAFRDIPMSDTDEKVLQALLDNPGSSSEQLSAVCGWKDKSWHMHFGNVALRRAAYLPPPTIYGKDDTQFWSGILADLDQREHPWKWTMRPEVTVALAKLGLRPSRGEIK